MALTQIPSLQDPPPQVRPPREPDLYDAGHWESAYREMHDFPTLLIQAQDELARSRKREAFWMSLFVHAVVLLLILSLPKFEKYFPHRVVMRVNSAANQQKELTFLAAPPDAQKVQRPQTDKMSDKNRVAMSKQPKLDREQLKKLYEDFEAWIKKRDEWVNAQGAHYGIKLIEPEKVNNTDTTESKPAAVTASPGKK